MISSTVKRRTNAKVRKPSDVPISAFSSTLTEKPKRGRRTIPDSHLLGARDQWTSLLEESWPDIGWPLLQIRERPTSTIDYPGSREVYRSRVVGDRNRSRTEGCDSRIRQQGRTGSNKATAKPHSASK